MNTEEKLKLAIANIAKNTGKTEEQVIADIIDEMQNGKRRRVEAIAQVLRDNGVDPAEYLRDNLPK